MTDLFSPRRNDGRAEWRVVYDIAAGMSYGDDLTFERLEQLLDTDDRTRAHRAVRRCNRQFTQDSVPRVLGNIRGVGYRVLAPGDYAPRAQGYAREARRKMTTAVDLMKTAPTNDMTPAQREWAHRVTMVLIDNELRLRSTETWQKDAEKRLAELERRAGIKEPKIIEHDG